VRGELSQNEFKRALRGGVRQVGFWLTLASPNATEVAAGAGFDWLLIDMEHAPNEVPLIVDHLRAAACGGPAEPVVRVPWNEPVVVKRLLDCGVRSFMFPFVEHVEDARRAVAATRYPPEGMRGYSGVSRATHFGRVRDYVSHYAEEIAVIVQIESPAALAAIPEIASVDGIDGVFIGPNDLAANMGHVGRAGVPEVRAAIDRGLALIRAAGKPAGLLNFVENDALAMFQAGFTFVAVGSDTGLLARNAEKLASVFKNKV
jgi:4-hydroxy-2-oxoheptanedioate aldolase